MEVCSAVAGIRKGSWTREEDMFLKDCIEKYGQGKWHLVPSRAGLNRCRKSCRLRWMNYLKPDIKRGEFSADEVDLILRLHKLLGNRWSLIAGRIPGRTANDVKNYWNTHLRKKVLSQEKIKSYFADKSDHKTKFSVIKPRPRAFHSQFSFIENDNPKLIKNDTLKPIENDIGFKASNAPAVPAGDEDTGNNWWERLLDDEEVIKTHTDSLMPTINGEISPLDDMNRSISSLLVKDDSKNLWTDFMTDLDFWDPSL